MFEEGSDNVKKILYLRYRLLSQIYKSYLYTQGKISILFPFTVGKMVLADIVKKTGGNIEETVMLLGGAIKANSIPTGSMLFVSLYDVRGTASIPDIVEHSEGSIEIVLPNLNGITHTADNILRTNGELNCDSEVELKGNASFYGYTIDENSAGGITYTINATDYIADGKTIIIGGNNGSK